MPSLMSFNHRCYRDMAFCLPSTGFLHRSSNPSKISSVESVQALRSVDWEKQRVGRLFGAWFTINIGYLLLHTLMGQHQVGETTTVQLSWNHYTTEAGEGQVWTWRKFREIKFLYGWSWPLIAPQRSTCVLRDDHGIHMLKSHSSCGKGGKPHCPVIK